MKNLLSIVFCLGIVFSSVLAFAAESESPPVMEKMEFAEAPVVYSADVLAADLDIWDFTHTYGKEAIHKSEPTHVYTYTITKRSDLLSSRVIASVANDEPKPANTINQGRDVYVSNIGYTSTDYSTMLTVNI